MAISPKVPMRKRTNLRPRLCALAAAILLAGCMPSFELDPPPPPSVAFTTVTAKHFEVTDDLPGRVVAIRTAEIRSQVGGIVQRRLFEQGSEIKAGEPLFQINPAPFKAEADTAAAALLKAQAVAQRAITHAERLYPLAAADAVSGQVYDDAVAQRDQAVADVAQAKAVHARRLLDLRFATVEAPISGRVDQALVTEGALVGPADSQPLARIQQIDQVYVDVRQPVTALESMRRLAQTSNASEAVTILGVSGQPYPAKGKILFAGAHVDAGTSDVLLRVLVKNPQRDLLPGMFVRARVHRVSYPEAITVPQQAVVRNGGEPQVWVMDDQKKVRSVAIQLGELIGGEYRVKSGLELGQRVIVEGVDKLNDGAVVVASDWHQTEPAGAKSAVTGNRP